MIKNANFGLQITCQTKTLVLNQTVQCVNYFVAPAAGMRPNVLNDRHVRDMRITKLKVDSSFKKKLSNGI